MARQQLIHLHTSGTTESQSVLLSGEKALAYGEIAVQHNSGAPKLYIKVADNSLAEFIDSVKVGTLISNAQTTLQGNIDAVASDLADELSARTAADQELDRRLDDVEAAIGTGQGSETSLSSRVDALETGLENETSARTSADTAINSSIESLDTRTDTLEGVLSGLTNSGLTETQTKAASALQGIASGTSGDYVTVTVGDKSAQNTQTVAVSLTTKELSASTPTNGLAVANDVKSYIDTKISGVTTTTNAIEQDVDALEAKLSGLTNADLTTTQSQAASALQSISAGNSGDYMTVTIPAKAQGATSQTVAVSATTVNVADATANNNGLAVAKDVKDYADGLNTAMDSRVDSLESFKDTQTALTAGEWGNQTIKQYIDSVSQTATNALKKITAGTAHDYVTVTVGNVDSNQEQTVEVAVAVQEVSGATAAKQGLADAYSAKSYADGLNTAMNTRVVSLETFQTNTQAQLNGFSNDSGSVKTYIDNTVSSAITSVYKVKGSVQTYADLPGSNLTVGDVYNVVEACTVGEGANAKVYPAGTNFVYTSTGWDALGGTVDLSPYMLVSSFETYSSSTNTRLGNIETNITNGDNAVKAIIGGNYTSANTVADAISALESGSTTLNNSITAETKARQDADAEINAKLGNISTASTVATRLGAVESKAGTNETNITALQGVVSGYTGTSAIKNDVDTVRGVANTAVQTVVVSNTATNGITASKSGTEVTLNFDNMVIDCGTY